jgi:hypothetical protein
MKCQGRERMKSLCRCSFLFFKMRSIPVQTVKGGDIHEHGSFVALMNSSNGFFRCGCAYEL